MFSSQFRVSEDEDDFIGDVQSSRTNLSNIFGVTPLRSDDNLLKYVAPKQENQTGDQSQAEKSMWKVQVAKVVSAFKLVNQENVLEGKVGLALLRSIDGQHKIILYRNKNKILSTFTIGEKAQVYVKNSYFQFRDDLQVFWSILFENSEECEVVDLIKDKIITEEYKESGKCTIDGIPKEKIEMDEVPEDIQKHNDNVVKLSANSSDDGLKQTKAQLLSRMAKMGKPLPKLSAAATDFSDSSDTEAKTKVFTKPIAVPRKPNRQQLSAAPSSNVHILTAESSLTPYISNQNMEAQCLNMFLVENRTQNAEIRINMSKLEAKIEKVLDKVDMISSKNTSLSGKYEHDEILDLEEKLLLLKRENRCLKIKIDELNKTASRQPEVGERIENSVSEFKHLIDLFDVNKDEYDSAEDLFKVLIRKYCLHCESLQSTIDSLNVSLEEYKHRISIIESESEVKLRKVVDENETLKADICDMKEKLENLEMENKSLAKENQCNLSLDSKLDNTLKDIMNNLYQTLTIKFEDGGTYTSAEILKICGGAIKNETKNVINKINCNNK